jgi:uncharacterized protein (TIGR02246 family)
MTCTQARIAPGILFLILFFQLNVPAQAQDGPREADISAIKQVVAGYTEAFNHHDAHATAMLFDKDADFTNLRGTTRHGQSEIEQFFGTLYSGILKNAHRTETVKNIRFLSPEIAMVDDLWEITGAKTPDGADNPDRKGLFAWVLTKAGGQWQISVFHEVEFPK